MITRKQWSVSDIPRQSSDTRCYIPSKYSLINVNICHTKSVELNFQMEKVAGVVQTVRDYSELRILRFSSFFR